MDYWVAVRKLLIASRSSLTTYDHDLRLRPQHEPGLKGRARAGGKGWNALASLGFWEGVEV